MFYGVISDDQSHLENARAISCAECSKLTRAGLESIGREKFTLSYWEVVKADKCSFVYNRFDFPQRYKTMNYLVICEILLILCLSQTKKKI